MKYLIFLILISTCKAYSAKLSLCDIPWTDAAHSWTWEGRKEPVKNRNLFGAKITIAGKQFEKGIAGHTGFSVVYNLSGEALRFTALAGIDDQAHPRDPETIKASSVNVVILVDRNNVFNKIVHLHENPVPIDIDLTGKHQLELRGEFGTGFHKQRIAFVNPELTVLNKRAFLKTAENWQAKVAKEKSTRVAYPAPPEWKNIAIQKIKWNKWQNAYKINNSKLELVLLPELGGRIISLKKNEIHGPTK